MSILGHTPGTPLPAWTGPAILLVDLDAFFASVEQLDHPGWRGKPVIVGGNADRRGVVATASYEARAFGVRSAMPSSTAARLCPDAIWTRGHYRRYQELSASIMAILGDESPFLQQVSIDEAFLDVTPSPHNPEHPYLIAARIQQRVSDEIGVSCSVGIGSTKTIAKIASDQEKPHGLTCVLPGFEQQFLAPLPIRDMSGIGAASEAELKRFGIRTLGDLAQADQQLLRKVFGKNADLMRQRALGGEHSPVASDRDVKSVSNETSFAEDLTTAEDVQAAIATMATKVGRRLRQKGLKGSTLSLKIRLGNRSIKQAQMTLPQPSDDDIAFTPLLFDLLHGIWAPGTPIRLVGVGVSHFEARDQQLSLFDGEDLFDAPPGDRASSLRYNQKSHGQLNSLQDGRKNHSLPNSLQDGRKNHSLPNPLQDGRKNHSLLSAADAIKDKFGEDALSFGHELRNRANNTGTTRK